MDVQISAKNISLTNSTKNYVNKRFDTLTKLIDPKDTSVFCRLEIEKTNAHQKAPDMFRALANLHIAGKDFRAESEMEKLYEAIDETKNQLSKDLRRTKTKKIRSFRKGGLKLKSLIRGEE